MKKISKNINLTDPYITVGNRIYTIGNQKGEFPRIGWHIEGEMGGVWAHPIKLLNEYSLSTEFNEENIMLKAIKFEVEPTSSHITFENSKLEVIKSEFVPDDLEVLSVEYKIKAKTSVECKVKFNSVVNIIGAWTAKDAGFTSGDNIIFENNRENKVIFKDSNNSWFAGVYSFENTNITATEGELGNIEFVYDLKLEQNEEKIIKILVVGSSISIEDLNNSLEKVINNLEQLKIEKAKRYEILNEKSKISLENEDVVTACEWLKYNADMMIREIPNLGRGYGAGFPYYPWWFGTDACYTIPATLSMSQHEESKDTLRLIKKISDKENGNGRIIHETSTFGVTYNKGNTQETPHFVKAVNQVFLWTGDLEFVKEMYEYCKKGILGWLLGEMDKDNDLLADGYGIIELYCLNLEMLDTAVLTYEALEGLYNMAKVLDDKEVISKCEVLIPQIKNEIEVKFWMKEEGLYADMSGSLKDMKERIPHLMKNEKMDTYKKNEMKKYFENNTCDDENKDIPWLMKNWIIVSPLEAKLVDETRAKTIFERLETDEFTDENGLRLCGVKRDGSIKDNKVSDDIYALDISMSISSGVMAYAEALYGRASESFEYIKKISKLLYCAMPGAISENLPDKGCFLQSWSSYGVNWSIVGGIMGISPIAYEKIINISPTLPNDLDYIKIENMLIGNDIFDISIERINEEIKVIIQNDNGWKINVNNKN